MQNRPQTITKARFRRFCRLVGKGMNFFGILKRFSLKYLAAAFVVVLFTEMVFGFAPHAAIQRPAETDVAVADSGSTDNDRRAQRLSRRERRRMKQAAEAQEPPVVSDTLVLQADSLLPPDSLRVPSDSLQRDTTRRKKEGGAFLEDIMNGKNTDSLVYDIRNKMVYIYNEGDINYQDMNLKADFMRVNMDTREIYAYGKPDTLEGQPTVTRPEFTEGSASPYKMDTITYNFKSGKAKIKGVATQEGDGWLIGGSVKKMPDNNINIQGGKYTTCDQTDHPHFYLAMTKAKMIPGKKVIVGPSYLVMEDVPIYPLMLPFGFFPTTSGRQSGFIVPSWGEENQKGFFLRDAGYYFAFNDYIDLTVLGGIYTFGSWEASVASRYTKRYKYSGSFNVRFSKDIIGEKGDQNYMNMNNYNVVWTHQQDPKFRPNSSFTASVNFSSSGYSKYGSQTIGEYLNTQTNSSIAYSKSWAGTPFSLSTNFSHSQNSQDSTVSLSFPNVVFNVARIYPFRRKNASGKQRWYEKISLSYTGTLGNNVTVKERDLFTSAMFKKMKNGVNHQIPISTSFNLFNYLNISPSANYQERWYFRKIDRVWDPVAKTDVPGDTTTGFYRLYDYRFSVSGSTKIYGMFQFKKKDGLIRAIRHMLTPTVSFNYTPDFSDPKYGYYKWVQSDTLGNMKQYSPFSDGLYGVPGSGRSMAISFGLSQTLEMKVRDNRDTSGVRKIKVIDNLSISSSYNFLADSMNLAPFSISLRTTLIKNLGLNISATLDPYDLDANGRRINRFMLRRGKLGRLTSVSTSFGYSFNSPGNGSSSSQPAMNDINSGGAPPPEYADMFAQPGFNDLDPNTRRQMMSSSYYDFNIPWNIGFNYSFSYSKPGLTATVVQTLGFNGSVNLTPKWGVTFNAGYDFKDKKLTPGTFTLTRDLHCWQMHFNWVPIGFRKSWSFTINVKSAMLKDLKYDKNSSFYDNLYDR